MSAKSARGSPQHRRPNWAQSWSDSRVRPVLPREGYQSGVGNWTLIHQIR